MTEKENISENNHYESDIFVLDEQISELKKEMKLIECLSLIEKCLVLKSEKYGKKSIEFIYSGKQLCEVCNLIAIGLAEKSKIQEGLFYLLKAEKLFNNYKEILNICLNNLGCYHIIIEDYEKSLVYLEKALKLSVELGNKKFAGETYLNISTVFNKMSKYPTAIEQCFNSIIILQELITDPSETLNEEDYASTINILIISYRNLAVLYDNSNDIHNALLYYKLSEEMYEEFRILPASSTILKDSSNKNSIIDNSYKLTLFRNLRKDTNNLFKKYSLIGKEGKDYYVEYLNEAISYLESTVGLSSEDENILNNKSDENNLSYNNNNDHNENNDKENDNNNKNYDNENNKDNDENEDSRKSGIKKINNK